IKISVRLWIIKFGLNILNAVNIKAIGNAINSGMNAANAMRRHANIDIKNQSFHNLNAENLINIKATTVAIIIVMNNGMNDVSSAISGFSILNGRVSFGR